MIVDLPDPDSPTNPTVSLILISNVTFLSLGSSRSLGYAKLHY